MTPKSICKHLAPYSIYSKRKTTIAHAFASALAPTSRYDEKRVEDALLALGQNNLKAHICVYCGKLAKGWDHLKNLVRSGQLSGYGHQLGNLVPACGECNSKKGRKPFKEFVESSVQISQADKALLIERLENHLRQANPISTQQLDDEGKAAFQRFQEIQKAILNLMVEADNYAEIVRSRFHA